MTEFDQRIAELREALRRAAKGHRMAARRALNAEATKQLRAEVEAQQREDAA